MSNNIDIIIVKHILQAGVIMGQANPDKNVDMLADMLVDVFTELMTKGFLEEDK